MKGRGIISARRFDYPDIRFSHPQDLLDNMLHVLTDMILPSLDSKAGRELCANLEALSDRGVRFVGRENVQILFCSRLNHFASVKFVHYALLDLISPTRDPKQHFEKHTDKAIPYRTTRNPEESTLNLYKGFHHDRTSSFCEIELGLTRCTPPH